MDAVDRASLIRAVKAIVYDARRTDSLHTITPRIIRSRLEADFGLEEGTLKAEEHKGAIREAIAEATSEPLPAVAVEKRAKPKRKVLDSDDEEEEEAAEAEKRAKAQARKRKPPKKPRKSSSSMESGSKAKRASTTKQAQKQKQKQAFKSAEMVPTSDVEAESDAGDDDKMEGSSKVKVDSKKPVSKEKKPKSKAAAAEDSGSELSVLEDAAPKKKGKKKATEKQPAKSKKSTAESSPDDETIKKLKSFIKACGVNKVWGKVFKDISNPKEQIRILKGTLADLGMTGRMSMDKAKAIRERRELAQELEDVQQFAAAQGRGAKRKPAKEEVAQDDSEEENVVPAKRKTTARQTIDAFLQGQSSDDD
ncbi:E3 ubiquitin isg15 ligase trim25-like [Mycena kentingensis (nom. inval.)]|nr:E3 ubiquitin isg15 ligase trim25-like [Mycena kentingensis (nom. inval.)]